MGAFGVPICWNVVSDPYEGPQTPPSKQPSGRILPSSPNTGVGARGASSLLGDLTLALPSAKAVPAPEARNKVASIMPVTSNLGDLLICVCIPPTVMESNRVLKNAPIEKALGFKTVARGFCDMVVILDEAPAEQ